MAAGDYLDPHEDDLHSLRLAPALYLSPDWEPGWGGRLQLLDAEWGGLATIGARLNTLVIFDVARIASHRITPVTPNAGARTCNSVRGWVLSRPREHSV
jgi:Rps23 Pro-64 3,4-dihydroxylase Tpa1-like proline 4-hydroxylase